MTAEQPINGTIARVRMISGAVYEVSDRSHVGRIGDSAVGGVQSAIDRGDPLVARARVGSDKWRMTILRPEQVVVIEAA